MTEGANSSLGENKQGHIVTSTPSSLVSTSWTPQNSEELRTREVNERTSLIQSSPQSSDTTSTVSPSEDGKQSSIVTIFALWNTMMGVSLLCMPWGLHQAGFAFGLVIHLLMCLLCLYTAYLVAKSPTALEDEGVTVLEFHEICKVYLRREGEIIALVFSVMVLVGAILAYWVLMSNFVYFSGRLLYNNMHPANGTRTHQENGRCHVQCHTEDTLLSNTSRKNDQPLLLGLTFDDVWQLQVTFTYLVVIVCLFLFLVRDLKKMRELTVPIYLIILIFPLLNFKSPTFFAKFNVLGTISVVYLLFINGIRLVTCGFSMDFSDTTSPNYVQNFNWNFPALTGMLTLSFFIHNCIITLLRNQRYPENNVRDLSIGYGLVAFSYIFVGLTFYVTFPLPKSCIDDNLLNNFEEHDPLSAIARVLIFFQLLTILPLVAYFIRSQISCAIFKTPWPGRVNVLLLNMFIVFAGALTAIYFPDIGEIVRYVGALTGMVYTYALPCLVHMRAAYLTGKLSVLKIIVHTIIIAFGVVNLIAQPFVQ